MKKTDYEDTDRYFELWKEFLKQGMSFGEALFKAQGVLRKKREFKRKQKKHIDI